MSDQESPVTPVPESRTIARKQRGISLVWVIPIVAAVIGAWVAVATILSEGPKITITFSSAEGLEAGKTKIEYKGVDVGTLTAIRLSDDHSHVIATAQMAPKTDEFLVEDTEFWVVKPRVSGANVTGLGTLISGSYVGMQIGNSKEKKRDFAALDIQPVISGGAPGRFFVLKAADLGSLDSGTPIFFRRLQVGQVSSYQLDKDGRLFTIKIFVRAPYDQYVSPDTRFWQASGIDMQLTASGLRLQTQSLLSILIGGVAFETPASGAVLSAADENAAFTLYGNRAEAFEPPPHNPQVFELTFDQSVRGLSPGAPVEFRGIRIGQVTDVSALIDAKTLKFSTPVIIEIDAERLGVKVVDLKTGADVTALRRKLFDSLIAHGVRAQLQTGNLLTGAAMVEFNIFPGAASATINWANNPVQLPTVPGQLEATEASIEEIIRKVDAMPLKQIGENLQKALGDVDLTLVGARGTLDNANSLVGPNSAQLQELGNTLHEISRAARSVRVLADYLERHPEALIRGKTKEVK